LIGRSKQSDRLSRQGAAELETFHQEVMSNLKLAFSVFMSGDVKIDNGGISLERGSALHDP
jgi:Na+/phosphate symporter